MGHLTLHCHHQNEFAIKMGSGVSDHLPLPVVLSYGGKELLQPASWLALDAAARSIIELSEVPVH